MRELGLHVFSSAKAGVGRSTLAVCTAKLLAIRGQRPVMLDLSFLGTSLADGLSLCAPDVEPRTQAEVYPVTGRWLDVDVTRGLLEVRRAGNKATHRGYPLPFGETTESAVPFMLNDALEYALLPEFRGDAVLWRDGYGARYLPTSPARADALRIARWMGFQGSRDVMYRLAWLIDSIVRNDRETTDVIIELPPGFSDLGDAGVWFAERANALPVPFPRWKDALRCRVALTVVTTPARNDWYLAIEHWKALRERIPSVRLLINFAPPPWETKVGPDLAPILAVAGDSRFVTVEARRTETLGRLFVVGDIKAPDLEPVASTLLWRPDAE